MTFTVLLFKNLTAITKKMTFLTPKRKNKMTFQVYKFHKLQYTFFTYLPYTWNLQYILYAPNISCKKKKNPSEGM